MRHTAPSPTPRRELRTARRRYRGGIVTGHAGTARTALVIALCLAIAQTWAPGTSSAGCNLGAVNCGTSAGTMTTCSAALVCTNPPVSTGWTAFPTGSMNVTFCNAPAAPLFGDPVTFNLIARAMVASPTDRSCAWDWASGSTVTLGNVKITSADGLPVELMDFAIEDDAEAAPDAAPAESAPGSE